MDSLHSVKVLSLVKMARHTTGQIPLRQAIVSGKGGAAAADASLKAGDQLVAVAGTTVKGADFDACLGAIQASSGAATRLVFFRGPAPSLYGSLGASDDWMAEFMGKHAAQAAAPAPAPAPEPAPAESA